MSLESSILILYILDLVPPPFPPLLTSQFQSFFFTPFSFFSSERGNQREKDRERAQARANQKAKQSKSDGLTPEQRRERDAKALQEKAARKAGQRAGGSNMGGGGGGDK
ncbi:hypothetical protein TSUD_355380 [Trifolium subterraneum]|uniref:Small EDRK-rich factor-like N-terminal domain-containing protein n=1 Tax=Trifolium subterraneum TaxID=3900 RepID=A0A2Z6MZX4_TRISU|nr:hypothetical protein TSUD_355380 [Trifolium subterraneum]